MGDSSYDLFSNERYAPMFWLHRWDASNRLGEHEVALGYAHLAYLLCEQFSSGFKSGESKFIDAGIKAAMASYTFDPKNMAENEFVLYFEGLKLIALRNILGSLMSIGCFQEAKDLMEFITTPENWLLAKLSDSERARLVGFYDTVSDQADIAIKLRGGKSYLRHDSRLLKSSYDVDLSSADGVRRLNQYIFFTRAAINPMIDEEDVQVIEGLRISRGRQNKAPSLLTLGGIAEGSRIWRESAVIGVTSDIYAPLTACECCLLPQEAHPQPPEPPEPDPTAANDYDSDDSDYGGQPAASSGPCCHYARDRLWPTCFGIAKQLYHVCWNWDNDPVGKANDGALSALAFDRSVTDSAHTPLLIRRVLHACRRALETGKRIHPLQFDVLPFLRADCERAIPWGYKIGIVEIVQLLITEGIDPFTNDDWDIRTILTLWRKLGSSEWNTIVQKRSETSLGPVANFSCVYPIFSFLEHSCSPNARVRVSPLQPTTLEVQATREILPGERITISRIAMDHTKNERFALKEREQAFKAMGMRPCQCQYCYEDRERIALGKYDVTNPSRFKDADEKEFKERMLQRQAEIDRLTKDLETRYPRTDMTEEEKKFSSLKTVQDIYWEEWREKNKDGVPPADPDPQPGPPPPEPFPQPQPNPTPGPVPDPPQPETPGPPPTPPTPPTRDRNNPRRSHRRDLLRSVLTRGMPRGTR